MPTYTIVNRLKTSACTPPENISKYRLRMPGIPTSRYGTPVSPKRESAPVTTKTMPKILRAFFLALALLYSSAKAKKKARKIFGIVFVVTGALSLLGLTGVPYLEVGIPGILSLYFDIFSGGVQALVFSLLTMVYVGNACPPPAEA